MNEEQFKRSAALLSNFKTRSEITLEEIPAPQKLAKFAYALSDDVSNGLIGEAEAELAYLNRIGVIDAIITDDVDTFLFGATMIIRK